MDNALSTTRRSWHAVAELVLAGPQYRRSGTIRLRSSPGGFATTREPDLRLDLGDLVAADRRVPIAGSTCADLAKAVGVDVGAPEGLYHEGSGVGPHDELSVDRAAARELASCFTVGDEALRLFAPDSTPVLWPEHFDLGITLDEVNYGVSPGDSYLDEPYAYVGPWRTRSGPFWNAPFGATLRLRELSDAKAVAAFVAEGREHATRG